MNSVFDYVIVGAGSAGCTLANRLSADGRTRVLLLEAGGWDRHPLLKLPLGWGRVLLNRMYDWGYDTQPEPGLNGRSIEVARGKVIGGSSSINAMAYVRGNRADYDRWASRGLPTWSYESVLPYFRRQESWEGGASAFRGGDGPLATRKARYQDPLVDAYLAGAAEMGYAHNDDYNGEKQDGFGRMQMTIRGGHRESAATAYLHPVRGRTNLVVEIDSLVSRVLFDRARARGVDYVRNGQRCTATAEREVILCGGAINSPQLLMLSGVGDPTELAQLGIAIKAPLPGVGRNLQDHVAALLIYGRRDQSPLLRHMRADRLLWTLGQGLIAGKGFATELPGGITGFVKSSPDEPIPDIQLLFIAGSLAARPYLPPFWSGFADSFACRIVLLRPQSRGRIKLASTDPAAHPTISQGLLSVERDWQKLSAGIRIFRDLARLPRLAPHVAREIGPGEGVATEGELKDYVRKTAVTAHHPCGTCRMGVDDEAVVDGELRVRGVEGLRVVDASVFPDIVGGNINAPVIMIAEKAADLILGRSVHGEKLS
ncbi:MAG TPA: GMC family oxidoreductase N-terminal domain-containing protein [Pseudolabrys sp.]|nr:GMC family oxidoreductase N-terminal domain-containing protein [Pseudolabrys sp.]